LSAATKGLSSFARLDSQSGYPHVGLSRWQRGRSRKSLGPSL
jgi:hypothetical protein